MMVLGLDPGTRKCGYAVIEAAGSTPAALGIAKLDDLEATLRKLTAQHAIRIIAIGSGTNVDAVSSVVRRLGIEIAVVDERETTLRARSRFFRDHPPRGWRRLVPRGMLLPDRPIDDYAALLIAERYLGKR
jgi:RNase H-fold protein (predicted Holliday junction resolvase)